MNPEQQDLLDRFAAGAELMRDALQIVPAHLRYSVAIPGEWTAHQVLVHLRDSEIVGAGRFRQLLAEAHPDLYMYAQADWATQLAYDESDAEAALALAAALRADTAALLRRSQNPAIWQRTAQHRTRGVLDLAGMLELYIGHVEGHRAQLHQIAAALGASDA